MAFRSSSITIDRTDNGFTCRFPAIHRRGIRRNGCGALLFGALPCLVVPPLMVYFFQLVVDQPVGNESAFDKLVAIFTNVFFWGILGLGWICAAVFLTMAFVTYVWGGKTWLKIQGRSLKTCSFFGGEGTGSTVDVDKITDVSVEPLPKESDHIHRGQIRITGPEIEDVIIGDGYPIADLERVADELKEYIYAMQCPDS